MAVIYLGNNSKSDFLVYEDTPIFVTTDNLYNIQGSIDIRALVGGTPEEGVIIEGRAFSQIPNLSFFLDEEQRKSVKSSL